jgi:ABC-type multidrug transport system fused ATPase/permease subunit
VLMIGGVSVAKGTMTIGDLVAFYAVLGLLRNQLLMGAGAMPTVISGTESLARIEEILNIEASDEYRGRREIAFAGAVEFRDVGFAYVPGSPVLDAVTFSVEPGDVVSLLGPNGAGKSTILSLIAGLYAPQRGEVMADGVPLEELDLIALRRRMAIIVQDPLVLPTTVAENIGFGRPDATREELEGAARKAGAEEFIRELPGGYEARVGDDGVLLSGGQRQRIALARALLREPPLLMLDEPTSHLDEHAIDTVASLLADRSRTILIVTHDPVLAAEADRVIHVRGGRLIGEPEEGRHSGVRASSGSRAR